MTVMSGQQEQLMDTLLQIAGGDIGIVERAFREAEREPGEAPAIEDVVYSILTLRGHGDIAEKIRAELRDALQKGDVATAQ